MHTCKNICFIFLYAFFLHVIVSELEWPTLLSSVFVCLRAPNVYICILSHLGEGPERGTEEYMPPSEPPLLIVKSRSLVSSWFWPFCWFSFLCNAFIQQNVRVGAAGYLKVMGLQTNGPFGKTIANDTVKHLLLEGLQPPDDGVLIPKCMNINKTLWNIQSFKPSRNVTSSVRHEI